MPKSLEQCRAEHPRGVWEATIPGHLGTFVFRKPSAREWLDFDAARTAFGVSVSAGSAATGVTKEFFEQAEQLCVRVIVSHSPQELQDINEDYLGIFFPLANQIADVVDGLRSGAGKGSPRPGAA